MNQRISSSARATGQNKSKLLYNEDAEQGVLGSILLDSSKVLDFCIEQQIEVDSFYIRNHQTIYAAMLDMLRDSRPIDVLTLADRLKTLGKLDEIGGTVFLNRLIDSIPTAAHAEYYTDIVRQNDLLRRIIDCARNAENECYTAEEEADIILSKVEQNFFDISAQRHGIMTHWPQSVKETMKTIDDILEKKGISGIPSGFRDLDKKLLGLHNEEMIVIAGRPSMGKTSLAMNIVENIALGTSDHTPKPVGIFSLEMSRMQLIIRMLGSHSRIPAHNIAGGYLTAANHGLLVQASDILMKAPIYLDDTGGLDILELRARARRMKKRYGIELFVVDYLQLLHSRDQQRQGRQIEISSISGSLKVMAKELRVPVLVVSQLNRAPEARDRLGRPRLADLRDSGAIEQDADVVCLLRRPSKYNDESGEAAESSLAILDIAKQRNGPTGEINLIFLEDIMRFENSASEAQYGEGEDTSSVENEP